MGRLFSECSGIGRSRRPDEGNKGRSEWYLSLAIVANLKGNRYANAELMLCYAMLFLRYACYIRHTNASCFLFFLLVLHLAALELTTLDSPSQADS